MLTSIALGLFIIFVVYVMVWSIKNDGARSIADQTGSLKMRDTSKTVRKSTGQADRRPGLATTNGRTHGRERH